MDEGKTAAGHAKLSVERASPDALAAAEQRWPAIAALPEPQQIYVASDVHGTVHGAGALDQYPVPFRREGRALRLFVDEGPQAMSVRSALVESIAQVVRDLGFKALYAGDSAEQGSDEWRLWRALGFEPNLKLTHYQVQLVAFLDMLTPLYDALTVRGRVPIEARVVPLAKSPIGEVIHLQMEFIGGDAGRLETRLRGKGYFPFNQQLSRVALLDDHVCGILLAQVDRYRRLMVESKVVAPAFRRGWVNIAVMQEAAQAAARQGFDHIRFLANERQRDTHRLAAKAGSAMHQRDVMVRLLAEPPPKRVGR